MQIALKHREEIKELLGWHENIVRTLLKDMEAIAEPIISIA